MKDFTVFNTELHEAVAEKWLFDRAFMLPENPVTDEQMLRNIKRKKNRQVFLSPYSLSAVLVSVCAVVVLLIHAHTSEPVYNTQTADILVATTINDAIDVMLADASNEQAMLIAFVNDYTVDSIEEDVDYLLNNTSYEI